MTRLADGKRQTAKMKVFMASLKPNGENFPVQTKSPEAKANCKGISAFCRLPSAVFKKAGTDN